MIIAKTWYKTHNNELLIIVESFKIWRRYLKSYKYKVFILTDYNNPQQFIDIKSLNFFQGCRTKELSCYYF